jgi:prepilin-type N-terminal cleavage/methylation domain-containing protein/prepilin-type processing-associated H-X9-DG protein
MDWSRTIECPFFICRNNRLSDKRKGVTLIELLVSISIIGLLVALFLPAVQAVREGARKAQCANNLRQMGLAAAHYHEVFGLYPPVVTTKPSPDLYIGLYSLHVRLLPYLDQASLFNSINFQIGTVPPTSMTSSSPLTGYEWTLGINATAYHTNIGIFLCPSDAEGISKFGNNYRGNAGVGPEGHLFAEFKDSGNGLYPEVELVGASSIPDGLSNTAGISERLRGSGALVSNDVARGFYTYRLHAENADLLILACRASARSGMLAYQNGGHYWFWSGREHTLYSHSQTPNGEVPDCLTGNMIGSSGMSTARSMHSKGANISMADGSVRFVPNSISSAVWRAIGSRNGGEISN